MEGRRHTDDCRRFADTASHGILPFIHICVNLRQRSVVADGTHQDKGNFFFHTAIYNAVINPFLFDKGRNRAVVFYLIDRIDMIIMASLVTMLGIDVLTEGRL